MNQTIKKTILIVLLCNAQTIYTKELYGKTFFSPRAQITNSAKRLVGKTYFTNKTNSEDCYGTFSIMPEYIHSHKTRSIAEHYFATDTLRFSGSMVQTRSDDDILADYFGMSPTFDSLLTINPKLKAFVLDFYFHIGLDGLYPGLYFRMHTPVTWVQTEIELCEETITNNGTSTLFPELYMDSSAITAPATSAKTPFEGNITYGHVQEGMHFGTIQGKQSEKGFADIQIALGYNFIRRERGHAGFNLFFTAPTGTQPRSKYLFEPIVGNGKHWELGVGFTGDILLWEKDAEQTVKLNVDCSFSHLFKSKQCRTFDFTSNGFGSRFILLKQYDDAAVYNGTVVPAINKTTLACEVSVPFQMDLSLMASYKYNNWNFDFGYNGWIRSHENICLVGEIESNRYGFKGIQNVSGADEHKTQSTATLHGNELTPAIQAAVADSVYPRFISTSNLDTCSAAMPRSISHKLFTQLGYMWENNKERRAIPYVGVGGEFEFEGRKDNRQPNKSTLSIVGIWLQGGLAY